ncbi:polyketide synthase [Trichoderma longibrachiatum ATCC 18648]|uniref:Polyketide synthase n=1 Tax=Trichoderma longibrachiatum ATCC 18648 TaxID=983965 RepID=A0A2T4CB41_TRILO|nr:polyketide synthase [Trichoderma longibrachiatum ATCC 18648]
MASTNGIDPRWLDANGDEPIAIIGTACRFSGTASNEDGLWQLLSSGRTSWASNARNRFKMESFWHPQAHLAGSTNARGVHLLQQDPAVFDSDFFGISGVEAKAVDPQQRLMLEVAYETFENAGIPIEQLEGSNTGVFCAVSYTDYDQILGRDQETSPMYRFTGTGPSLTSARVSYAFDLHGPSKSVDTACSSASVALHDAILALRAGDADQILVGGCNLILDPDKMSIISSMSFLSPDGRCYSFDDRASGYARGEGVVGMLLKPLSAALRDGDPIRSVIRGSAVVSDGKTPGITMPSPDSQYAAIQRAYSVAGLDPKETVYVEAHGTGTNAGDNCEVTAFNRAFCSNRPGKLIVGSAKSNLGHTECVSGLTGLYKVLLMLEKGAIVPTPTFQNANPRLQLEARGIEVASKLQEWPEGTLRRASVNGSGYGGTDTHVILEAWSPPVKTIEPQSQLEPRGSRHAAVGEVPNARPKVFVWSHQREDGFSKLAVSWKRFIMEAKANHKELSLDDLAYTLASRRTRFAQRASFIASNVDELLDGIKKIELGSIRPVKALADSRTCFIFTGQGAQWAQMGLELFSAYPLFAESMRTSEMELIRMGATWRLIEELKKPKEQSRINDAELAQPCCTAIQVAFVDLLASWGVHPDMVCGHSSGEIAAAYAGGSLTASEAIKVAYHRGKSVYYLTLKKGTKQGGMLAAGLSETDALKYTSKYSEQTVNVACINSPSSVTISGDVGAIEEIATKLEEDGVFNRRLAVPVAYHSYHMAAVGESYGAALENLKPRQFKPSVRMISSVNCEEVDGQELDGSYWVRNLLRPVRFAPALAKLLSLPGKGSTSSALPPTVMVELGPHPALQGPATQTAKTVGGLPPVHYFTCLKRKEDAVQSVLTLAGGLFNSGLPITLTGANNPLGTPIKVLTDLPSYNWNHGKTHWNESRRSQAYRLRKFPRHDLLGAAAADSVSAEPSWRMFVRLSEIPWVRDHCIDGQIVFSAAGFLTMIVEAVKRQSVVAQRPWKRKVIEFKQVVIDRPLLVQEDAFGTEVFILLRPYAVTARDSSSKWQEFRIYSVSQNNESTEHCRGLIGLSENKGKLGAPSGFSAGGAWTQLESKQLYKLLSSSGNGYTGCFANLDNVSARAWESSCELTVPNVKATMPAGHQEPHHIHPTTLEGCFLACLPGVRLGRGLDGPQVVASIDELCISTDIDLQPGHKLSLTAKSSPHGLRQHISDIFATDSAENVAVRVGGIKFSSLGSYQDETNVVADPLCHRVEWLMDPFSSPSEALAAYCQRALDSSTQQPRKSYNSFSRAAEDESFKRCYAQLAEYLKLVQYKVPNLRILEVGGGAGALASVLLEVLYGERRDYATTKGSYVFTDASDVSISGAKEALKAFEAVVEYKTLAPEQSPAQQGFDLHSFDVIVASNAIHAALSLEHNLGNFQSLLKPGGQIAFAELVAPSHRWGLNGNSQSSPHLSTPEWEDVLVKSGFSGVSLELKDFASDEEHEVSLLISNAATSEVKADIGSISIVTGRQSGVAEELRSGLLAQYPGAVVSTVPLAKEAASAGAYIFLSDVSEEVSSTASEKDWENVRDVLSDATAVLWVTKGALAGQAPHRALITGLARSLRLSRPDLKFFTVDIDAESAETAGVLQVYEKYLGPGASPYSASEWELAISNGSIVIPRLLENKVVNHQVQDTTSKYHPRDEVYTDLSRSLCLRINSVGVLDSLYWADDEVHALPPSATQVKVQLESFALNFKDMQTITGQLEGNSSLLLEGTGRVVEVGDASQSSLCVGDRVSFFAPDGLATLSNVDVRHAVKIPGDISSDTAAAVPVAYSTALYALRDVARLQRGDSILIHSGAGAVGQAAIALAKAFGVEDIYVSAGSPERAEFITSAFGIPASHIVSSRDLDLGHRILELTNGRGVDVVVGSLSGDAFSESCSAVAPFGRIIQLCERDVANNGRLDMKALQKNVSLSVVNMGFLAKERPLLFHELLETSFSMLQKGALALIGPIVSSHASKLAEQLRLIQAGDFIGKSVFQLDASQPLKIQPRKPKPAALRENSSYLIAGNAGHLDAAVAKYLAKLGARRLIASQGSGIEAVLDEIKSLGTDVVLIPGNASDQLFVDQLREASADAPVRGIILGDSEIPDANLKAVSYPQWSTAVELATKGITSLQEAFGSNLDFFILLNRTSALVGGPEQTIASAIGAFRDSFAQAQASQGFPVKAIALGAVEKESSGDEDVLPPSDIRPQTVDEVLAVINYAIQSPSPSQIICGASQFAPDPASASPSQRPDARFAHVWSRVAPRASSKGGDDAAFDVQAALRSAATGEAAIEAVFMGLKQKLAKLLAVPTTEIQPDRAVSSYGVDSLVSVELRNWITGHLGGHVQMLELMSSMAMVQLSEVIAKRSRLVPASVFGGAEEKK